MFEAVQCLEFHGGGVGVVDELGEHPASVNGVELAVIADQDRPPVLCLCELAVVVEESGVDHRGFIDDHHRLLREVPLGARPITVLGVFMDEFVQRVRVGSRTGFELPCGCRGRADTEHCDPGGLPCVDGRGEHAGLARPGRADNSDHRARLAEHHSDRCCLGVIKSAHGRTDCGDGSVAAVIDGGGPVNDAEFAMQMPSGRVPHGRGR